MTTRQKFIIYEDFIYYITSILSIQKAVSSEQ